MQFSLSGTTYVYSMAPHLDGNGDWHDAYAGIIERFTSAPGTSPTEVPLYPLISSVAGFDLTIEMGAYWEGALIYIRRVLGKRDALAAVERIISVDHGNAMADSDELFCRVWNSHGQLKWLRAHLVRERLMEHPNAPYVETDIDLALFDGSSELLVKAQWLARFVEQHCDEGSRYPNPYFGGSNPLHLHRHRT